MVQKNLCNCLQHQGKNYLIFYLKSLYSNKKNEKNLRKFYWKKSSKKSSFSINFRRNWIPPSWLHRLYYISLSLWKFPHWKAHMTVVNCLHSSLVVIYSDMQVVFVVNWTGKEDFNSCVGLHLKLKSLTRHVLFPSFTGVKIDYWFCYSSLNFHAVL